MDLAQEPEGSVIFGWVAPGVYFSRFKGHLSVALGAAHGAALERAAATVPSLRYFCDSSALTSYDLLARSGFVRVLLSHRKKFNDIFILKWAGNISQAERSLSDTVGEPLVLLDDRAAFEHKLTAAAPHYSLVLRMPADVVVYERTARKSVPRAPR
jgi:hypothetical protein